MLFPVIHIVKRFGRVGGMESYVWNLTHGLAGRSIEVVIVCEQVIETPLMPMHILKVEASPERPRWRSMLSFRAKSTEIIRRQYQGKRVLIHSHERSLIHHVTTFHGPPIDNSAFLQLVNRRVRAWYKMETAELSGENVQTILPVSSLIRDDLLTRHPSIVGKKIELAWPGVNPNGIAKDILKPVRSGPKRFLFVGREGKRKGLDIAIKIVSLFRETFGPAVLTIFGVERKHVTGLKSCNEWVQCMGWQDTIPWLDFDILLHPARKEPFGMVVAEARARGLPVLISNRVGAADLDFNSMAILDIEAPIKDWCEAAQALLSNASTEPECNWSWDDLVDKHVREIYSRMHIPNL